MTVDWLGEADIEQNRISDVVSCCNLVGALPLHIPVSYLNVPEISPRNLSHNPRIRGLASVTTSYPSFKALRMASRKRPL